MKSCYIWSWDPVGKFSVHKVAIFLSEREGRKWDREIERERERIYIFLCVCVCLDFLHIFTLLSHWSKQLFSSANKNTYAEGQHTSNFPLEDLLTGKNRTSKKPYISLVPIQLAVPLLDNGRDSNSASFHIPN